MRNLMPLTYVVATLVAIDTVFDLIVTVVATLPLQGYGTTLLAVVQAIAAVFVFSRLATIILFSIWIYQAGKNLVLAGYQDLEFTPGSRIWWFAVPFANLVMPFKGMRELWNASHGETAYGQNNTLVSVWWALWILNGLAGLIFRLVTMGSDRSGSNSISPWIDSIGSVALATAAILLIIRIARAQRRLGGPALEEVFA
jgi:hypothetical protein